MNSLCVTFNQDKAGNQDAMCIVRVDGKQVGPLLTVSAIRGEGRDVFELRGDWPGGQQNGNHSFNVEFMNDHKAADGDRNLYLQSATINGHPIKMQAPIKMSTNGPCPPVGFYIAEVPYSIPEQFGVLNAKLDAVAADVGRALRDGSAQRQAILDALAELRADVAALKAAAGQPPSPPPAVTTVPG